jgi:hypothetical protein
VFTHTADQPSIEINTCGQINDQIILGLVVTNPEKISGYSVWFEQGESRMQVIGSKTFVPSLDASGNLRLKLDKAMFPTGKYWAVVRALDLNKKMIEPEDKDNAQRSCEIIFAKMPWYQALFTSLVDHPLLVVMLVIVLLLAGFIISYLIVKSRKETDNTMPAIKGKYKTLRSTGPELMAEYRRTKEDPIQAQAASIAQPKASLLCLRWGAAQALANKRIALEHFPYLIGRSTGCDLSISDPLVSGKHLYIDYDNRRRTFSITDLKSTNGTMIDHGSSKSRLAADTKEVLNNGAIVELGPNLTFRFEVGE